MKVVKRCLQRGRSANGLPEISARVCVFGNNFISRMNLPSLNVFQFVSLLADESHLFDDDVSRSEAVVSLPSVRQDVIVGERDVDLEIVPQPPLLLRGSVVTPAGGPWGSISVRLSSPAIGNFRSVTTDKDGAFEIPLPAGEYLLDAKAGNSLILQSAVVSGVEVTDRPFTLRESSAAKLVLTDRSARVTGQVQGLPVDLLNTNVLLFPVDASFWTKWGEASRRMRGVRLRAGNQYEVAGLPPGDYWVAAVVDDLYAYPYRWQHPDYLRSLIAQATSVFLPDAATTTVDLKVRPSKKP